MILLPLFICFLLRALSAQAEVVTSFSPKCNNFFYKGKEPAGMDQNAVKICQKNNNKYHFATLYSTHHRIPLYSAYTFNYQETTYRPSLWMVEPQLSDPNANSELSREEALGSSSVKASQAINDDYKYTEYDCGHLNPECLQCDGRKAMFTLTNAAPMHERFNRIQWRHQETWLRRVLHKYDPLVTTYIVTGAVPHPNYRIPERPKNSQGTITKQSPNGYERVTVPTHIWTAVCVHYNSTPESSYSFAFIGQNLPKGTIQSMSISELNSYLGKLYYPENERTVQIFADECPPDERPIEEHRKEINLPTTIKILKENMKYFELPTPSSFEEEAPEPSQKEKSYDSFDSFFSDLENMKQRREACVMTYSTAAYYNYMQKILEKSDTNTSVRCKVVPEKSNPQVMTAADGSHCVLDVHYCKTEKEIQFSCTTPCLYNKLLNDYRCYSGHTEIQCSPQYSTITINGEKCRHDHQCGTYGKNYYWCYKDKDNWDYCLSPLRLYQTNDGMSCRPDHPCGNYGKKYLWCYIDFDNNWGYC